MGGNVSRYKNASIYWWLQLKKKEFLKEAEWACGHNGGRESR